MKRFRHLLIAPLLLITLVTLVAAPACGGNKPPNLTPEASADFTKTRVIQSIDVIFNTAVAANAQNPPLLTTDTVRKIVLAHKAFLVILDQPNWQSKLISALTQLQNDLSSNEAAIVTPYITLALTILQGVSS